MLLRVDQTGDGFAVCVGGGLRGCRVEQASQLAFLLSQVYKEGREPGVCAGLRCSQCALNEAPWSDCQQKQKPVSAGGLIAIGGWC